MVDSDRFHDVGIFFPALWVDWDFDGRPARRARRSRNAFRSCGSRSRSNICRFSPEEAARYASVGAAIKTTPGYYRKTSRAPKRLAGEAVAEDLQIEDEDSDVAGWESLGDDGEC